MIYYNILYTLLYFNNLLCISADPILSPSEGQLTKLPAAGQSLRAVDALFVHLQFIIIYHITHNI